MRNLSFEEYKKAVIELAHGNLKEFSWFKGEVCQGTIEDSYGSGKDVEYGAIIAELDTLAWESE